MRFCHEGVLMPFGASRQMFDTPNPTFFQEKDVWPMMDHADPIAGWSLKDILQSTPLAKHDIYGGLFFHLREVLIEFCTKLQTMKVNFVLLHTDAANLPDTLGKDLRMTDSFDRIDVSNITDQYYLGLKCLHIFAPLLRPLNENPCATLVTLFMNAIGEVETQADAMACTVRELPRLLAYLPPEQQPERSDTDTVRLTSAYYIYQDFDSLFERYKMFLRFDRVAKNAGLREKSKHTIVKPWPLRLRKNATKAEFEKLFGSPHRGNEHYVEWKRLA